MSQRSLHVVWDWNGTIFDDAAIVISATNDLFVAAGHAPVSPERYRSAYRRPIRAFYADLAGTTLTDDQWIRLDQKFHDLYHERAGTVALADGVADVFAFVQAQGWTQSLLSMFPHQTLLEFLDSHGLHNTFIRVDGLPDVPRTHPYKATYMEQHVKELGLPAEDIVVIGDSMDDVDAAVHVKAHAILYNGGLHADDVLDAAGVPVAHSMADVRQLLETLRV